MPLAIDEVRPGLARGSAPAELVWVVLWLQQAGEHKLPPTVEPLAPFPAELVRRVGSLWDDGSHVFSELLVLADLSGHLFDLDPGALFDDLVEPLPGGGELPLRSETPAEAAVIRDRLRRLAADAGLRRRYVGVLREVWGLIEDRWRREGLTAVQAAARVLGERAARASEVLAVVPDLVHSGRELREFAEEAFRRGDVVFSPTYFGSWYLVMDLPHEVLIGAGSDPAARAAARRQEMELLAGQLRALADASRLAILAHLAETPLTVTDLVRVLQLAQPTVSGHLRLLREAGLVRPQRLAGRTEYTVERARLGEILKAAAAAVPER
jgi:DNA-binding transcriptional ArsR family regulator